MADVRLGAQPHLDLLVIRIDVHLQSRGNCSAEVLPVRCMDRLRAYGKHCYVHQVQGSEIIFGTASNDSLDTIQHVAVKCATS